MSIYNFYKIIDHNEYEKQIESVAKEPIEMEIEKQPKTKRAPGRPKRPPPPSVDSDPPSSLPSGPDTKRHRRNWFEPDYIHKIIDAVKVQKSFRAAVTYLQNKYRKLPSESEGMFDSLDESTVRYWFDDNFNLKEQFAEKAKPKNNGGRPSIIPQELFAPINNALRAVRGKGQALNSNYIRLIIVAVLKKENRNDILDEHRLSITWIKNYVREQLDWSFRRSTTSSKLPHFWRDEGVKMLKRLAVTIYTEKIPSSLVINLDQTGVHLLPKNNYTWEEKNSNGVSILGNDDKRAITAVIASTPAGDLLPLQLIFKGKTNQCHPVNSNIADADRFHITHSENHWSTQATMEEYIEKIIIPFTGEKKAIVLLDCWKVHKKKEFRSIIASKYPNIILIYIPPNCTSKLQVADTHLNFPFKTGIRYRFNQWSINGLLSQLSEEKELDVDTKLSTLKPRVFEWCVDTWRVMKLNRDYIIYAWKQLFDLFDPFDEKNQTEAMASICKKEIELKEDFKEKEEEDNSDDDAYDSDDDDYSTNEIEMMTVIRSGERKSTRVRQPVSNHFMVKTDELKEYNLNSANNRTYYNVEKWNNKQQKKKTNTK